MKWLISKSTVLHWRPRAKINSRSFTTIAIFNWFHNCWTPASIKLASKEHNVLRVVLSGPSLRAIGRNPKITVRGVGSWYSLGGQYPKVDGQDRDQKKDYWPISNTKVSNETKLCRSCELSFKVGVKRWGVCWVLLLCCHCPMMTTRWSQRDSFLTKHPSLWGHFKIQDVSSFLCALVIESGSQLVMSGINCVGSELRGTLEYSSTVKVWKFGERM